MGSNAAFTGSVPDNYHRFMGPMLFEPYARDMAARLRVPTGGRALELACGTGIVTRAVLAVMPPDATLVASDLNEAMLNVARRHAADPRVAFAVADAQQLAFPDRSFDALFCQFGVMFFPDKTRAMREARRVLAPGGRCVFNTWDSLEHNPMTATVHAALGRLFPSSPPDFYKTPFGWFDRGEIERLVRAAGFDQVSIEAVTFPSVAPTADDAARGLVEGTPVAGQLRERGVTDTEPVVRAVAEALAARHGRSPCRAPMRALVIEAG